MIRHECVCIYIYIHVHVFLVAVNNIHRGSGELIEVDFVSESMFRGVAVVFGGATGYGRRLRARADEYWGMSPNSLTGPVYIYIDIDI